MEIKFIKTLIISATVVLLIAGCASMGGGSGVEMLATGGHSNIKDQEYLDIHNQADFDAMWKKAFENQSSAPDKPVVDFSKNMILAAFIGDQKSGGYRIEYSNIDSSGATINVTVTVIQPGQNCRRPESISDAFLIVTIPASSKPVNYNTPQSEVAPACG